MSLKDSLKEKILCNRAVSVMLRILFAVSTVCFTFVMSRTDDASKMYQVYIALSVSAVASAFIGVFCNFPVNSLKKTSFFSALAALIVAFGAVNYIKDEFWKSTVAVFFQNRFSFVSAESAFAVILYILFFFFVFLVMNVSAAAIIDYTTDFFLESSRAEKRFFITASVVLAIFISFVYSKTTGFWSSMDKVYSIDSSYNINNIFPNLFYADIRHVGFSIITFPLYTLVGIFSSIFGIDALTPILLAVINAEMILFITLILRRLSGGNNFVAALYLSSSPVWIFTLFIEKYTIAVLLMVAFVYAVEKQKISHKTVTGILSAAAISTSCVLIPLSALGEKGFKNAVKRIFILCGGLVLLFIVSGRINYIIESPEMLNSMKFFTKEELTLFDKFKLTTDTICSLIFVLPFVIKEQGTFWWYPEMGDKINYVGLCILVICIIGFLLNFRKHSFKIFAYWILFVFFLYIVIGFSVYNGPLFGLYFNWAFIPLFVAGTEGIFRRHIALSRGILCAVIAVALIMNVYHFGCLFSYMQEYFPVVLAA